MRATPFGMPPRRRKNNGGLRLNQDIQSPRVRLIGAEGEDLAIVSIEEALAKAADVNLDLVEIAPNSEPPVCKLLDHGKYRYREQKKRAEAKRRQKVVDVKEIKVRPRIGEHDLDFKLRTIRKFLEEGNRVKVSLRFRGREMTYLDQGEALLKRVTEALGELAKVVQEPQMEGRQMIMIIAPNKVGGAGRKAENTSEPTPTKNNAKSPPATTNEATSKPNTKDTPADPATAAPATAAPATAEQSEPRNQTNKTP